MTQPRDFAEAARASVLSYRQKLVRIDELLQTPGELRALLTGDDEYLLVDALTTLKADLVESIRVLEEGLNGDRLPELG